jgi:hypothetical protein
MKMISMSSMALVGLLTFNTACSDQATTTNSQAEFDGLLVEFTVVCEKGDIALKGTISNTSDGPKQIENGALPWDFEPTATRFDVTAGDRHLSRKAFYPPIGRTGPLLLAPKERKSGSTPIGFLFPEIRQALVNEPVVVAWFYQEGLKGSLEIRHDPC